MRVASQNPDKLYIVVNAGVEYNDETYDVYRQALTNTKYYKSLEEVRSIASVRLREELSDFRLGDLGEWEWQSQQLLNQFTQEVSPDNQWNALHEHTFGEFITWCEISGYKWEAEVPLLLQIVEVTS